MLSAKISASSNGDNTLVAAVTGKKIRIVSFCLSFSGAVNAKFQSGAGGTDLTGLLYGAAGVVVSPAPLPVQPGGQQGLFETATSALLNLNLSAGIAVGGWVDYELVP